MEPSSQERHNGLCCARQNLRDMRENNWVARREVEGPKKITDVHEDAKREVRAFRKPTLSLCVINTMSLARAANAIRQNLFHMEIALTL